MGQIQNRIMALDVERAHILEQKDKSYERIKMLRIQRDKGVKVYCLPVSYAYGCNNIMLCFVRMPSFSIA